MGTKREPQTPKPKTPKKAKAQLVDASVGRMMERYAGAGVFRTFLATAAAVLAANPGTMVYAPLLGALDVCLTGGAQRVAEERLRHLAESLAREFTAVRAETIRHDYFHSPDGTDVLMRAIQSGVRVKSDQQRDAIARIVVAAATNEVPPAVEPASVLAVLAEMSENEAVLLGVLWREWEKEYEMPPYFNWETDLLTPEMAPQGEFLLRRLIAHGLLIEHSSGRSVDSGTSTDVYVDQDVAFTATGAALMRYLKSTQPIPAS